MAPRSSPSSSSLDAEKYAHLKAELKSPYRPLRQFVYVACAASGLIGAFVILTQLLAGRDVTTALPNFALQLGVVALMVWLFRLEWRAGNRAVDRERDRTRQ
jgi:hypothetical protein